LFGKTKLYIEATSTGTIGTTQCTGTLLDATLNVNSGWKPRYTADGQKYFKSAQSTQPEITLDVTFEHNAVAVGQVGNWMDETAKLIRLKAEGSAATSAGSYSYKTLIIDLAGKWASFDKIEDDDGNDIISGTFQARYDSTAATYGQIIVVNETTTLP